MHRSPVTARRSPATARCWPAAARRWPWWLLLTLAGCQPQYGPLKTSVRVRGGEPADAMVTIDDQPIAPLGVMVKRGFAVLQGRHRISIERPGYFPWDRIVEAGDELIVLDVSLQKLPE